MARGGLCKPITNFRFKNSRFRLRRCLCAWARARMRTYLAPLMCIVQHIVGVDKSKHTANSSACEIHSSFRSLYFEKREWKDHKIRKCVTNLCRDIHPYNAFNPLPIITNSSDQMCCSYTHAHTHKRNKIKDFLRKIPIHWALEGFCPSIYEHLQVYTAKVWLQRGWECERASACNN